MRGPCAEQAPRKHAPTALPSPIASAAQPSDRPYCCTAIAPVTIGKGCTIGHHAIIHGCSIGENSLIGMGATVLNGAKIGNNCLVGANALVTEGKEFPDNSLIVGSPARAIRTLDDQAIEGLKRSAASYIANWRRFAKGLKKID